LSIWALTTLRLKFNKISVPFLSEEKDPKDKLKVSLRHASIKRKKVCPKCFGDLVMSPPFWGWLMPQEYRCKACGYHGTVFLEPDEQKDV